MSINPRDVRVALQDFLTRFLNIMSVQQDPDGLFSHMGAWINPLRFPHLAPNPSDSTKQQSLHAVHETNSNRTTLPTPTLEPQLTAPQTKNARAEDQSRNAIPLREVELYCLGPHRHSSRSDRGKKRPLPRTDTAANDRKRQFFELWCRKDLGERPGNEEAKFWKSKGPAPGALVGPQ